MGEPFRLAKLLCNFEIVKQLKGEPFGAQKQISKKNHSAEINSRKGSFEKILEVIL